MNIPRFKITKTQSTQSEIKLDPAESHHALGVMRLGRGDAVELFDGEGRVWSAVVLDTRKGVVKVQRGPERIAPSLPAAEITLAPCVIKSDAMDLLIEKASELGVSRIAPIVSERTVVRLAEDRRMTKIERWKRIARESAKQCGRATLPEILAVATFREFIACAGGYDMILMPTLSAPGKRFAEALEGSKARKVLVLIGPEGDFTVAETESARKKGAVPVSLGPLVMRSETASLYVLSCLNFFYGEACP